MSSLDEKFLLNIGDTDWTPPCIDEDTADADDFVYNETTLVKFAPNYKSLLFDKHSSIVLYDDPTLSSVASSYYRDNRSTGTNRHKYKAKKVKELRPLKYRAPRVDSRKTLDPNKFNEASILSQIDLSKSFDLQRVSSNEQLPETVKRSRRQNSHNDKPALSSSMSMDQLAASLSNQAEFHTWSNDDDMDKDQSVANSDVGDNSNIPLDDSISGFSPGPSFYFDDANNRSLGDPTIYREMILKTGALGNSSFTFKPPPSKRFSKRDKYGEFSVYENPVVSTKLEIAENEVSQLRSDLADRENEFLDKFKQEQLLMEARRRKLLELRAAEALKAAQRQAEISKLRREARERDERRRLEAERIAELKRLAEEEARRKAEEEERLRIQAIKDKNKKQTEQNESDARLMQLENERRLMTEEDQRSRAYQEQYEMARLMGMLKKNVVPTSHPKSNTDRPAEGPSKAELLRRAKLQQVAREMREKALMEEEDALSRVMEDEYKLLAMQANEKKKSTVEEKVAYLLHRMDVAVNQIAHHPRRVMRKSVMPPTRTPSRRLSISAGSQQSSSDLRPIPGSSEMENSENLDSAKSNELRNSFNSEDFLDLSPLAPAAVDVQSNAGEFSRRASVVSANGGSNNKRLSFSALESETMSTAVTAATHSEKVIHSKFQETSQSESVPTNNFDRNPHPHPYDPSNQQQGDLGGTDNNFSSIPDPNSTPMQEDFQEDEDSNYMPSPRYEVVEPAMIKRTFRAPWKIHEEDGLLFIPFTFAGDISFDPFGLLQPAVISTESTAEADISSDTDDAAVGNTLEVADNGFERLADNDRKDGDCAAALTWPEETIAAWPDESLISCSFYDVLNFKDIIDEDHHYYHVMNFQDTIDTDAFYQKLNLLKARHQKLVELLGSNFMDYEDDDKRFEEFKPLLLADNNGANRTDINSDRVSSASSANTSVSSSKLTGRSSRLQSSKPQSATSIAHMQMVALYNALDKIPNIDAIDESSADIDSVPLSFESLGEDTRTHFKRFRISIDKLEIRKILTVSVSCDYEESSRNSQWIVGLDLYKVDENGNNSDVARESSETCGLFSADQIKRHRAQNKKRYIAQTHHILPVYSNSLTQQAGITRLSINLNGCLYNDLLVDVFVTRSPLAPKLDEGEYKPNEFENIHTFRGYAQCTLYGGKVLTDSNEGQRKAGQLIRKFGILSTYNMSELFEKLDLLEASAELTTKDGEPYECEPPPITGKSSMRGYSSRRKKKTRISTSTLSSVSAVGAETTGNARKLFFSLTTDLEELNPETKKVPVVAPIYSQTDQAEFLSRLSAPRKLMTIDSISAKAAAGDTTDDKNTRIKKVNLKGSITPVTEAEMLARLLMPTRRKDDSLE